MLTHRRGDFSLCLPISPHDTPYIFIHHTSSWQPHQPTTYDAEPIRTIGLAIRIPYFNSFYMLRLCRNHSAFNSHNFPRTMVLMVHATTFQPYCYHRDLTRRSSLVRKLPASDCCTRGPLSCRLFPLAHQPGLFRCRFSSELCTIPCGITRHPSCHCVSVYSAYLPGLHSARPSAFAEGEGFEPPCHF